MEDSTESLGVKFKFRRDPKIPNGSVFQNRRFFLKLIVVGYSGLCDMYYIRTLYPEWTKQYQAHTNPGLRTREELLAMKRVK